MLQSRLVQPINVVNAGVQPSYCRVTTRNDKYFAYSAYLAVYVIEQKDFRIVNMITYKQASVSTVALSNVYKDMIAISFSGGTTQVIDIVKNSVLATYKTPESIVSLCWSMQHNILVGFTKMYDEAYTMNLDEGGQMKKIKGFFPNLRTITTFNSNGPIFIGGNNKGEIGRFDYTQKKIDTISQDISTSKVCSADVDPTSKSVIIVWRNGKWALYDASSKDVTLLNKNDKLISPFGGGCWVSNPPGHFVTGDSTTGVLRLWNSASTTSIESLTIHTTGFIGLNRLNGNNILCSFNDGMIAVFDMLTKKFVWKTNAAHRNTIFNLEFMPTHPEYLVSCGAEGSVCTWDTNTMKLVNRVIPDAKSPLLFSIATTPGGGFVVCGYSNGQISVFSNKVMTLMYTVKLLDSKIVHLSISTGDSNLILIGSIQGVVLLYNLQKKEIVREFKSEKHRCIGCVFSPHDPTIFGISRTDGFIDIYSTSGGEPIKTIFLGKLSLYTLKWSPINPNIIAVTSDEGITKVCDITNTPYETHIVHEHKSYGRGLAFHPTLNIVASGGLDGIVAIYDITSHTKLCSFQAHIYFCYGIAFSPINPYLMFTSGCDTRIMVWSIDRLFINQQINDIFERRISLRPLEGQKDLIKLSQRISRSAVEKLTFSPNDIVHINDIVRINDKLTRKMTTTSPTEGSRVRQAIKQKERYLNAAELMLKMGNIKKYCEYLFKAGEYMKAVAAAPGVSVKFWEAMMQACIDVVDEDNKRIALNLALGNSNEAVEILKENDKPEDAILVACAKESGHFRYATVDANHQKIESTKLSYECQFNTEERLFEYNIGSKKAMHDLKKGNVYLAAADYLSVGDVDTAIRVLLTNGELFAAETVNVIFESPNDYVSDMFALICVNNGFCEEGLKFVGAKSAERVITSVIFENEEMRNVLYQKVGIKSVQEYTDENPTDICAKIHRFLLIGKYKEAIDECISYMKENLLKAEIDWVEARAIIKEFEFVIKSPVQGDKEMDNKLMQIAMCAYIIAGYESIWKGLKKPFNRCFALIKKMVRNESASWAEPIVETFHQYAALLPPTPSITIKCPGSDLINPSQVGIPIDEEIKYGPIVQLDDESSFLSLQTLLELRQVTMFSPLGNFSKYLLF